MKIVTLNLDEVTSFGDRSFYNAKSLKELNAPVAESFGRWAFSYAYKLKTLNAPMAKSFGDYTFYFTPQHIKKQIKEQSR